MSPSESLNPYIQAEIPESQPITFFGQKDLPTPRKTAQEFYDDVEAVAQRLEEAAAENRERIAKSIAKD